MVKLHRKDLESKSIRIDLEFSFLVLPVLLVERAGKPVAFMPSGTFKKHPKYNRTTLNKVQLRIQYYKKNKNNLHFIKIKVATQTWHKTHGSMRY